MWLSPFLFPLRSLTMPHKQLTGAVADHRDVKHKENLHLPQVPLPKAPRPAAKIPLEMPPLRSPPTETCLSFCSGMLFFTSTLLIGSRSSITVGHLESHTHATKAGRFKSSPRFLSATKFTLSRVDILTTLSFETVPDTSCAHNLSSRVSELIKVG